MAPPNTPKQMAELGVAPRFGFNALYNGGPAIGQQILQRAGRQFRVRRGMSLQHLKHEIETQLWVLPAQILGADPNPIKPRVLFSLRRCKTSNPAVHKLIQVVRPFAVVDELGAKFDVSQGLGHKVPAT
jgi:hypothetical protein